jgi:transcriptional regulator with XRE-family HTH domain
VENLYSHFGACVRRYRRLRKLSQEQLGKLSNIGRPTIAGIEAGRQGVALHQAVALSKALNVELSQLIQVEIDSQLEGLERVLDSHDLRIVQNLRGST